MGESFHNMPIRLAQVPDGWRVLVGDNMNPGGLKARGVKDRLRIERGERMAEPTAISNINAPITPVESDQSAQAIVDSFKQLVDSCAKQSAPSGSVAYVWYHYGGREYEVSHIFAHDNRFVVMRIANSHYQGFTEFKFSAAIHINCAPHRQGTTKFESPKP